MGVLWNVLNKALKENANALISEYNGDVQTYGDLLLGSVYDMLKRMEKKTGHKITPHMLRRYFAQSRRQENWNLEMISMALGHKHLDTTIKYLGNLDDKLLEASKEFYEKHSELYGIDRLL